MSDFLLGAKAIAKKLEQLGLFPEGDPNNEDRVYYLVRKGRLPAGRLGKQLISTGAKLQQAVDKLVS